MDFSTHLFLSAILSGVLLGAFYASIASGLALVFGVLEIPNLAHPAVVVAAALLVHTLNSWGLDPLLSGLLLAPVFFVAGVGFYKLYRAVFESRVKVDPLRSFSLFFGISFLIEIALIMTYGVDFQSVEASYIGRSLAIGTFRVPYRMLASFVCGTVLLFGLQQYLSRTMTGRAIRAAGYDQGALPMLAINPARIRQLAFGLSLATAAVAGSLMIVIGPVQPSADRVYIGRAFAVVVLAGMGSVTGVYVAGILLGIAESVVLTVFGASWATAVSFSMVLVVLAVRPAGLFGRLR
jgi:branched-chain amino acid transport system permease protein